MMLYLTSHQILALSVCALWMKGAALSLGQVLIRVRTRRYVRPEDAQMMGLDPKAEDERVERLAGAWRNELEATPAFLALAIVHVLVSGSAHPFGLICLCFVVARFLQGWAQFSLRQPLRTLAFLLGFAATFALAVLVLQQGFKQ